MPLLVPSRAPRYRPNRGPIPMLRAIDPSASVAASRRGLETQQEGEAYVRRSRSRSLERWDSAAMSMAGPDNASIGGGRAPSTRFLGAAQDSAAGSVFATSPDQGGGVDEEKGRH